MASDEAKSQMIRRGAFIVLEGLDRSGKSTQADLLCKFLNANKYPTKLMRFPDRTTAIGKMLDSYLRSATELDDRAVHLLFSANRWEASNALKETLLSGQNVVCDRYSYSGVAFSHQKGLDLEWCTNPEIGLPAPDGVIYLTLSLDIAEQRGGFGNERYEKRETQAKVDKIFKSLQAPSWQVVDATPSIEDLHQQLQKLALDTITRSRDTSLSFFKAGLK